MEVARGGAKYIPSSSTSNLGSVVYQGLVV
jgi:hypothetical protein